MPNVFSPMDLVFRPDNMNETVPHTMTLLISGKSFNIFDDFSCWHTGE